MSPKEKEHIRLKLAASFKVILQRKKDLENHNRLNDIEDIRLVSSMRQLEAESGLSYTIIQGLFAGKRDIQFTTLISLLEGFGMSLTEFAEIYDWHSGKQFLGEKGEVGKRGKKVRK